MPLEDAQRWNARYADELWVDRREYPRPFLVQCQHFLPPMGRALDLAMGLGANAGYLARLGWTVVGVDVSLVAARLVHQKYPDVIPMVADLTRLWLPPAAFDLIMIFFYCQRDLLASLSRYLRPGGLAIVETLTTSMLEIKPELPVEFLLQEGELGSYFHGWEVVAQTEGWMPARNGRKSVARIAAFNP